MPRLPNQVPPYGGLNNKTYLLTVVEAGSLRAGAGGVTSAKASLPGCKWPPCPHVLTWPCLACLCTEGDVSGASSFSHKDSRPVRLETSFNLSQLLDCPTARCCHCGVGASIQESGTGWGTQSSPWQPPPLCPRVVPPRLCYLCPHPSSYKDTCRVGSGPTIIASFHLDYPFKDPICEDTRSEGLGPHHTGFGGTQFSP